METMKRDKPVYAHLCTWFKTRDYSGQFEMWNSDYEQNPHDPSVIFENGHRDTATTNYPLTDVYDSSDSHVIEYQFLLMKLARIDGVIVDWDGRRLNEYRHKTLMDIIPYLEIFDLKLILCFEEWCGYYPEGCYPNRKKEIEAAKTELQWAYDELGSKPFYGTINGKKPILVFRKIPHRWFNVSEWKELAQVVTKENGVLIFPAECEEEFGQVIDGSYFWVGGFTEDHRHSTLEFCEKIYKTFLSNEPPSKGFLRLGSVVPGFDDTPVWGWGDLPRLAPRYNGERYEKTWQMSIENDVDLVQIVTWNDWSEGSHIEPADTFGYTYLELTKQYSARYKGKKDNVPDEALRIPLKLFQARKKAIVLQDSAHKAAFNHALDEARQATIEGDYMKAEKLIASRQSTHF